jgi:hypothetical protein
MVFLAFRPMDSVRCTADRGCLDFLCQRFSLCFVTEPVNSETYKQNGCQVPTMVLSEARGLSLFRVIREGLGSSKRLCVRGTQRLTYQCRLALEPERLRNRLTAAEKSFQGMKRTPETLKLFVVSDVGRRTKLLSSKRSG